MMPSATSRATDTDSALLQRQLKRFYNVAFLLFGLKEFFPQKPIPPNHASDDETIVTRLDDDVELYKCFVNKIAQICDIKHGGDTPGQLASVRKFLSDDIFKVLHGMTDEELKNETKVKEISSLLLLKIIAGSRWRIYKYIKDLVANAESCIGSCAMDSSPEVVQESHLLLQTLQEAHTSAFKTFLRHKASNDERHNTASPWSDTRHAIGRLHSYTIAVRVIIEARKKWPDLFDSPEIITFPSADKVEAPFTIKERMCTGKDLLNRLTTDPEVHQDYEDLLPHLQTIDFDNRLKNEIKDPEWKTTVHAEVILLSNLRRESLSPEDGPTRFFMEDKFGKYIGCSKPTCLLCDYYFDSFPIRVDRRKGHGNFYHKWRVADIQGPPAGAMVIDPVVEKLKADRKETIEEMIKKLRKEVTSVLVERRGLRGSRYDSRHTPSDPFGSVATAGGV
ncbi:hypothetical protein B0T21DRAFT_79006 [Apiosordaria backusii]|uniref:Uncharacterized protein n=1 Tax=Apiosordaria backusii TaxID=314023 RepID=A0AA40A7B4_9PEZI|nr:hypothetical protein B0T21DRAFT_79006 [Apiosordaria backusii]